MSKLSRRGFLQTTALGAAGLLLPTGCAILSSGTTGGRASARDDESFYFIHMADHHIRAKRKGDEGYRACVASVRALEPRPELAIMGGDLAFDGNYNPKDEFEHQIHLYKTVSDELGFPYYNCLGNHDHFGLSPRRKCEPDDPDIGKQFILDRLGMTDSIYSFDHKGWHFAVLDTAYRIETPQGPSQVPRIGPEQLEWLAYDLGAHAGQPTIVVLHVAVFCHIGQINGSTEMPSVNHMVVQDTRELRLVLERHGVKAVLQGHSHMNEDYRYRDIWYITSLAVSGAWWGGNWKGYEPGYTVLRASGERLDWHRVTFPWEHQLEPEDTLERERIREREEFLREQQELLERERAGRQETAAARPR